MRALRNSTQETFPLRKPKKGKKNIESAQNKRFHQFTNSFCLKIAAGIFED